MQAVATLVLVLFLVADLGWSRVPIAVDGKFGDWTSVGIPHPDPLNDVSTRVLGPVVRHRYAQGGMYLASLGVVDSSGQRANINLSVSVPNHPPIARFTYSTENLNATFNASSSVDPDGSRLALAWDLGDGSRAFDMTVLHQYARPGRYTVQLVATDNWRASNVVTHEVTIERPQAEENSPPIPLFTISQIEFDITVNASLSLDVDGTIVLVKWDFGDGYVFFGNGTSHHYGSSGIYNVTLSLVDDLGAWSTVTEQARVPNNRPHISLQVIVDNLRVDVDASASIDPDGDAVSFRWTFGDGGSAIGPAATHVYSSRGLYRLGLRATDSRGAWNSSAELIAVESSVVQNRPPVLGVQWDLLDFLLNASAEGSYDPDGAIAEVTWDFGDGAGAVGWNVSHLYADAGSYYVVAVAYDNQGGQTTYAFAVQPQEPLPGPLPVDRPPTPVAIVAVDGYNVILDARGSQDDRGIAAFEWQFGDGASGPDIVESKSLKSGNTWFFYVALSRELNLSLCECELVLYVDRDGARPTGFPVDDVGAEFAVHVTVRSDGSNRAVLQWYVNARFPGDESGWVDLYDVTFAFAGAKGEGKIRRGDLISVDLGVARMVVLVRDFDGRFDFGAVG